MAYDRSILNKLGDKASIESHFNAAHCHLQASYCLKSFPSKVKIERDGELISYPGNINADEQSIVNVADFTKNNLGGAHLIVYICDNNRRGYAGIAGIGNKYASHLFANIRYSSTKLIVRYSQINRWQTIVRQNRQFWEVFPEILSQNQDLGSLMRL